MEDWVTAWRLWLVFKLWPGSGWGIEGHRHWRTCFHRQQKIELTVFDLSQPEAYGCETVYRMLKLVRDAERRMGWKCPEPS